MDASPSSRSTDIGDDLAAHFQQEHAVSKTRAEVLHKQRNTLTRLREKVKVRRRKLMRDDSLQSLIHGMERYRKRKSHDRLRSGNVKKFVDDLVGFCSQTLHECDRVQKLVHEESKALRQQNERLSSMEEKLLVALYKANQYILKGGQYDGARAQLFIYHHLNIGTFFCDNPFMGSRATAHEQEEE